MDQADSQLKNAVTTAESKLQLVLENITSIYNDLKPAQFDQMANDMSLLINDLNYWTKNVNDNLWHRCVYITAPYWYWHCNRYPQ